MTTDSSPKGRDQTELVRWMTRLGAVTAQALAERNGCSPASARGRLQAAARAGLATRVRPLHGSPSLFTATRAGLALAGLRGEEPTRVCAASASHQIACAHAAAALERRYPHHLVCGERELQRDERALGGRLASARMSWRSRWGDSHRPDLVIWPAAAGAGPVAVEVELTPKAPARLLEICRAWARCRHVAGVLYLAAPAALAPVARAIRAASAEDRIALLGLEALEATAPDAAQAAGGSPPASPVTGAA
jgi:hypothetical protein